MYYHVISQHSEADSSHAVALSVALKNVGVMIPEASKMGDFIPSRPIVHHPVHIEQPQTKLWYPLVI